MKGAAGAKAWNLVSAPFIALVATVVASAMVSSNHSSRSPAGTFRAAAVATGPSPSPMVTLPSTELLVTEDHAGVGWTLEPPPPGVQAGVTADTALATAQSESAYQGTTRQAILAWAPPAPPFLGRLVWIVRYEGTCVPVIGLPAISTPPTSLPCAGTEASVIINATDGSYVAEFSDK